MDYAEASQDVFYYTEAYAMPLLFTIIVSAISMLRQRLMSCNRMYRMEVQQTEQEEEGDAALVVETVGAAEREGFSLLDSPLLQQTADDDALADDDSLHGSLCDLKKKSKKKECCTPPSEVVAWDDSKPKPDIFERSSSWTDDFKNVGEGISQGISQMAYKTMSKGASFLLPAKRKRSTGKPRCPGELPPDVQVNILSFLHPKDIVTFAGTSLACREIVDGDGPTTVALWKTLWERDYGWLIHSWKIGRKAYERSMSLLNERDADDAHVFTKDFYFLFGLSYINYILAGNNQQDNCLVGLHGCIYDMTDFVLKHPGSPDTLLVHSGRDSTKFFDDMDHSRYARKTARQFCIAVDTAYQSNDTCGVKPTDLFRGDGEAPDVVNADPVVAKRICKPIRRNCLERVFEEFRAEQRQHRREFRQKMADNEEVLHSSIFYDPFRKQWSGWYTNTEFDTVFT